MRTCVLFVCQTVLAAVLCTKTCGVSFVDLYGMLKGIRYKAHESNRQYH